MHNPMYFFTTAAGVIIGIIVGAVAFFSLTLQGTPAMPEEKKLVITGNPVDGFFYYGPFDSAEEAIEWASVQHDTQDWWIAPLNEPATQDEDDDQP